MWEGQQLGNQSWPILTLEEHGKVSLAQKAAICLALLIPPLYAALSLWRRKRANSNKRPHPPLVPLMLACFVLIDKAQCLVQGQTYAISFEKLGTLDRPTKSPSMDRTIYRGVIAKNGCLLACLDMGNRVEYLLARSGQLQWTVRQGFAVLVNAPDNQEDLQFLCPIGPISGEVDPVIYWLFSLPALLEDPVSMSYRDRDIAISESILCKIGQHIQISPERDRMTLDRTLQYRLSNSGETWTNQIRWVLSDFRHSADGMLYPSHISLQLPDANRIVEYVIRALTPTNFKSTAFTYGKQLNVKVPGSRHNFRVGTILDLRGEQTCFRRTALGSWRKVEIPDALLDRPRTSLLDVLGVAIWLRANWPWILLSLSLVIILLFECVRRRKPSTLP